MSESKRRGRFADFFIRLWQEKPLGTISGLIILLLIVVAIFADVLTPYPYDKLNLADRLQGASARHLLGTDQLGRDLLSRLIFGARISLIVGLAATTINVLVALLIGGTSGFLGGKVDLAAQRFVDAWMAFPGLLLLLTIMSVVGQGLLQIIVVLGIAGGIGGSRVVRGAVIGIKENDYFLARPGGGHPHGSDPDPPCIAQYHGTDHHRLLHQHWRGHHCRSIVELPGIRTAHQGAQLGRDAQPGRAPLHGASALVGLLARAFPHDCRLLSQHVRRRGEGPAGSPGCAEARAVTALQRGNPNETSSPG